MVIMNEILNIKEFFASNHIQLSTEWLESCVSWCKEENLPQNYTIKDLQIKVYEQWLLLDLREVEIRCLPNNVSKEKQYTLNGNYALQLMKVIDISKPKHWQLMRIRNSVSKNTDEETESSKRVLQLTLTDGVQEIEAMEYKPIPSLNLNLTPGIKILIKGPISVRRGRLMLQNHHVKVLGGEVDDLIIPNAAENVLARCLNLPLNPSPKVIEESLLSANKDIFGETGVIIQPVPQNVINQCSINSTVVHNHIPARQAPPTVCVRPQTVGGSLMDFTVEEEMRIAEEIDTLMEVERERESKGVSRHVSNTPDMFDDADMNDYDFGNIDVPPTIIKTNEKKLATPAVKDKESLPNVVDLTESLEMENDFFENIVDAHLDKIDKDMRNKATPKKPVVLTIEKLLKNIPNISNGKFKIKATFKAIVEKLTIRDDGFHLVIEVKDETGHISVKYHSDLIADLAECSPDTLLRLKVGLSEKNSEAQRRILEAIKRIKEKLLQLDNIIEVQVNVQETYPVIVNILDIP